MRHRDALVDDEPLELVEDRGVRRVEVVGAEDLAGAEHVDRRLTVEHRADLHRGGVRAQDDTGVGRLDEEGVLLAAGRVVRPDVQRVEGQPLGLDLRALGDLPAHADEDVLDPLGDEADRVPGAERRLRAQDGEVLGLLDEDPLVALRLELALPLAEGRADAPTRLPDALARLRLGARGQRPDLAVGERQRGLVPLVGGAQALELLERRGARDGGEGGLDGLLDHLRVERGDLDRVVVRVGS